MPGDEESKLKRIVGLKYEKGKGLPKVIVKGQGCQVDEILRLRGLGKFPAVVKDEKLVNELYKLPIDGEINRELFELVAMLLVHVYAMDKRMKNDDAGDSE